MSDNDRSGFSPLNWISKRARSDYHCEISCDGQCFQPAPKQSSNEPFAPILNRHINLSPGYGSNAVIRWRDPVLLGAPQFSLTGQTVASAAKPFGFNCDYNDFLPLYPGASDRGILVVNHTSGSEMFPGYDRHNPTPEQIEIEVISHGLGIVEVERARNGAWSYRADSNFTPRKHTALGRFKREAANTTISDDGRVAVYSGGDQRFDYVYKFVSNDRFDPYNRMVNFGLLESGTLYGARFNDDGSGEWLPLIAGSRTLASWTQAGISAFTRLAANAVYVVPTAGPERGRIRRFMTGVPDGDFPRPSVVALYKEDGAKSAPEAATTPAVPPANSATSAVLGGGGRAPYTAFLLW